MKTIISIFTTAWLFVLPLAVQAADAAKEESPIQTVKIVLHPMPEPRPALKYRLLPSLLDLKPGNAALLYDRIPAYRYKLFSDEDTWEKIEAWHEAPLSELRQENVRSTLNGYTDIINEIIRAAHCEYCDWQLPIREQEFWTIDLADIQQPRNYARLLAAKARLQIADGKYDEAVQTLQAGYAMSRHVATGPTLIHSLVGCAIAGMMSDQVRELVQQNEAPNLYWALSSMPRPLIDFRYGLEGEENSFYLSFPELRDLEKKELSPDQWRILLIQTLQKVLRVAQSSLNQDQAQDLAVLKILQSYPHAKAFLIERGWPADKVEAMPVCQVVMIAALRQYDEIRDDLFKWIPFQKDEISAVDSKIKELARTEHEFLPITSMLLPALGAVKHAEARIARQIAILRVFEALRLYGASHQGKLPENLSDITEVPIPIDPMHGKPFIYHCDGNKAILESPSRGGVDPKYNWLRYEIQFVTKGN